ncbi:F-box only protein 3-like [Asterias rubens]|uniref:F-box only protein 3-like n=1 Tax=Asterias rubens TaxID=7604 RepID=UPI001455694D|nr:F-box only protein 3-like [Asterias rubens]
MEVEGKLVDFSSCLPDEVLLHLLSYVDFKDLCRLGCVCQHLQSLVHSDKLWRRLCHTYWLLDTIPETEDDTSASWYTTFKEWYQNLGQFIDCYATIKGYWNRIEDSLKERGAINIFKSLRGPLEPQNDQLSGKEENIDIPLDLLCSLHVHNGQTIPTDGDDTVTIGLGGTLSLYDYSSSPSLLSYEEILTLIQDGNEDQENNLKTLTVLRCPFNRTTIRMCLDSTGEFLRGFMFYRQHNFLHNFFHGVAHKGFFLSAESFTDWLSQLADRLSDPGTMVHPTGLFRFYHEPSCLAVTDDVKVTVATTFVPELSETLNRPKRMFSYHITMEMDKDVHKKKTCQLLTRHWEVIDGNGKVETVVGDGVIGAFPIIKPGTKYSWTSCTTFDTVSGSMGGHFSMVNLQTQEIFEVKCPTFHMTGLPFLRLSESELFDGDNVVV